MSVIFIFLDGVGYGTDDPERNPWSGIKGETLIAYQDHPPTYPGAVWKPLDACLGVKGIPQSATGTTSLLTGINAPEILGKHLSGFPNQTLREIIGEHSIHLQAKQHGIKSTFANAYNKAYFKRRESRQSVTTHAVHAAGIPFRNMNDYRNGKAVFHDLTGEFIRAQGNDTSLAIPDSVLKRTTRHIHRNPDVMKDMPDLMNMPIITPEEGGERIARMAEDYDIVLFEYVKTDMAGHAQDITWANVIVDEVMRFLWKILESIDLEKHTLLIASDHGNSEDLSIKSHTFSPVPGVAVGSLSEDIIGNASKIIDLVPNLISILQKEI